MKNNKKLKRLDTTDFFNFLKKASRGHWCHFKNDERIVLYELRERLRVYSILSVCLIVFLSMLSAIIPAIFFLRQGFLCLVFKYSPLEYQKIGK